MKRKVHKEKVSVKCRAIEDGQHAGRIIKSGEEFTFERFLINGKFPRWTECLDKEFKSEFSKLSESEQAVYLAPSNPVKIDAANVDIEKIKADLKAKMEAEFSVEMKEKLRQEVMNEMVNENQGEGSQESNGSNSIV
jgi:hypothetical protein